MADDSDLEKTEAPSAKRLDKAREEGNILRSKELGTLLLLSTGLTGLWLSSGPMYRGLTAILQHSMGFDSRVPHDPNVMMTAAADGAYQALILILPIFGALALVSVLGSIVLGGVNFSTKPLEFNLDFFKPLAGIQRMFSAQTVVELFKALLKASLIGGIGAWAIWSRIDEILGLANAAPTAAMAKGMSLVAICTVFVVSSLVLVAGVDVPWQMWSYYKKLRMSKQELKDEHKESEGNPLIKGRIRQQQRAMARQRMMAAVPKADVVVTNPTHYAVALSYAEGQVGAPKVVAKGMGLIAARIRELAAEHRVPMLEAPPLARALYQHVELDREIPAALYSAVAEVLAWVFQLRTWRVGLGKEPQPPSSLAVPAELDPHHRASAPSAAPEGV